MHSTEHRRYARWLAKASVALLSGCSTVSLPPSSPTGPGQRAELPRPAPAARVPVPVAPAPARQQFEILAAPNAPRNADELRRQAAERLVAANPDRTYMGKPQDILLAIPVLEVELNADGSVKRIIVMRKPGQAPETLQIAIDAVHRAAPYGNVSRLPKPWTFIETFLFNDDRRFKPRTLDGG